MTYRSHADIGGSDRYGQIVVRENGVFSAAWESRAMALMLATSMTGCWTADKMRSVLETLPSYDSLSYYEKWMEGLEILAIECGLVHADEIASARALYPARPVSYVLKAKEVSAVLAGTYSSQRKSEAPAKFAVGDLVQARASTVNHHTRLPEYVRGKCGCIERVKLWGEESIENLSISIDAWEPYLEVLK
jgi:hypothetical protein